MSVVVSVEDTGAWKKQVTVSVPAEEVDAETRKVVRSYAGQVRIPGFRKGKVPAELVRRRFREEIDREVVERLVPRFWERARDEQGLDPLGQPQLEEVGELAAGEPLRFVAVVEVRPEIAMRELTDFELPDPAVEPTDDEVDEALDGLRRQVGEWVAAERPAARGDRVTAHITELGPDGKPLARAGEESGDEAAAKAEGGAAGEPEAEAIETAETAGTDEPAEADERAAAPEAGDRVAIEVGEPNVWEELSLALTGLSPGQEGRFTRRPEGDAEAAPRTFRVKVEAVEERELPPVDDALAQKVGDFADVAALRAAITDRIRHDKRHERDRRRRESLLAQLRDRYPLQLPQGAVESEIERMANELADDLARRGVDPKTAQVDWQRLAGELREPAERRVHDTLLLDAAARREGIEVTAAEVEGAIGSIARAQKSTPDQVRRALGDRLDGLRGQIRRQKTVRRLLGESGPDEAGPDETGPDETGSDEARPDGAAAEHVHDEHPPGAEPQPEPQTAADVAIR